jgi:hypothetical protein
VNAAARQRQLTDRIHAAIMIDRVWTAIHELCNTAAGLLPPLGAVWREASYAEERSLGEVPHWAARYFAAKWYLEEIDRLRSGGPTPPAGGGVMAIAYILTHRHGAHLAEALARHHWAADVDSRLRVTPEDRAALLAIDYALLAA